jgi:hypothetical protein
MSAKDLIVKPITMKSARSFVKANHYSGKVTTLSTLHLGVFLKNKLSGVLQYGHSIDKRRTNGIVEGTGWNEVLELNRLVLDETLPKNSESRAISVSIRIIKKHYPHIKWIISFADGTQCGDGAIYRASGFYLTGIKKNQQMLQVGNKVIAKKTLDNKGQPIINGRCYSRTLIDSGKAVALLGFQLRYIYFIDKEARQRLTVPELPFSKIQEMGAGMYKGKKITRGLIEEQQIPSVDGGASPTPTLHNSEAF